MDFKETRACRIISTILVLLFTWTSVGGNELAFAAKAPEAGKDSPPAYKAKEKSNAVRHTEALEGMRKALKDKKLSYKDKKAKVASMMKEVEALDAKLRAEFEVTGKRLRDKGLPDKILKRHSEFVKHYESNMAELKKNAKAIKDSSRGNFSSRAEAALKHLDKVKPPTRHVPLDPNKLPHRAAEPTKVKPRTSAVEYKSLRASIKEDRPFVSAPVLLASNGDLGGDLRGVWSEKMEYLQLAMAEGGPIAADLSENVEVKFTEAINAKAAELGNKPIAIYEWVRNNVEFVPTYGSIQGADMCLQTMECNAFDTASLLIALLRTSGIPARYAYGTIEMPIDKLMNWAGGFTDPMAALNFFASGGIPNKGLVEAGRIKVAQIEHVWVESWVDMMPSMGTILGSGGKMWVPLDGSFKQYEHKKGMDLYSTLNINGIQFYHDYFNESADISPYQFYNKRLLNYLDSNHPEKSNDDVLGGIEIDNSQAITAQNFQILVGTLPYKLVSKGSVFSEVTSNNRHRVRIDFEDTAFVETLFSKTIYIPEVSGKRLTLYYRPATEEDENLADSYGGMINVPPYMLQVIPELRLDGNLVAEGSSVSFAKTLDLKLLFQAPNFADERIRNKAIAGEYTSIIIQSSTASLETAGNEMSQLFNNIELYDDIDSFLGQQFYSIGVSYFHHLNFEEDLYAKNFQMALQRFPSEGLVRLNVDVDYAFGMPTAAHEGSFAMDIDKITVNSTPLDGDSNRNIDFHVASGLGSSSWEDMSFGVFYNTPAVSAARILKTAHNQGIPIYTLDNSNVNDILPQIDINEDDRLDIENAINSGKKVIVHQNIFTYEEWQGSGYIVFDPKTGGAGYMVSGGLGGSETAKRNNEDMLSAHLKTPEGQRWLESRWITQYTDWAITINAGRFIDTPYVFGSDDPRCGGFDCSGFVQHVYKLTYGHNVFGERKNVTQMYGECNNREWLYSFEIFRERGDILFFYPNEKTENGSTVLSFSHTGIYLGNDRVIHASGIPEGSWNNVKCDEHWPDASYRYIPEECPIRETPNLWKVICGDFQRVIITSDFQNKWGAGKTWEKVCRPLPEQ